MISADQIARLAELYDRYNNTLDPFAEGCREARRLFDAAVTDLHSVHAADVSFFEFRYELIDRCREYLRKN